MKSKNPRDERGQPRTHRRSVSRLSDDEDLDKDTIIRLPIKLRVWNTFRGVCAFENRNAKKTIEELCLKFIEEWKAKKKL
jgi:hypothetical protein